MSALRNVPISRKFLLAFSLVCLMCLGLGSYTFVTLHSTSVSSTDLSEDTLPSVIYLGKVELAIDRTRRWDLGTMLCQTPKCTDRKSTRLNSSHRCISYAVFCLKK